MANAIVGRIAGMTESGVPLVELSNPAFAAPQAARSLVAVTANDLGRQVVLLFEGGDGGKPIIMGIVHETSGAVAPGVQIRTDNEKLLMSAEKEITLRCGEASITLTRVGKVLIRGNYVLSRSSGANSIKGASIELN